MDPVNNALVRIFGFHAFRPHQEEIVRALLSGRDVLAIMPTGGGKSLCYQLPACLTDGVAIVVSPLIALMKDQVDAARAQGIAAATLNSTTGRTEYLDTMSLIRAGKLRLLYLSPERLSTPGIDDFLHSFNLSFFAIDEAHCISEWGHDFRPDYLALARLATDYPDIPVAAFTATATAQVSDDIIARLGLRDPFRVRASFNRPNLRYRIEPKTDADRQLLDFIRARDGESGIVYRGTRKNVEATVERLRREGVPARAYHAGLDNAERAAVQEAFRRDETPVIVATIAFGMGIDKSNVRFVAHGDLPKNIEGYYQETGRAGRDGAPAECLLLHGRADSALARHFASTLTDPGAREAAERQLRQIADFAHSAGCRRRALLAYFGEVYPEDNCGNCDVCLGHVEREEATIPAKKALSAMVRTGGRFGAKHLTAILLGQNSERLRQFGHDQLPTFGVGRDRTADFWRCVFDELAAQGYAEKADGTYPTLSATPEGWRLLRSEIPFHMRRAPETAAPAQGPRARPSRAAAGNVAVAGRAAADRETAYCPGLFETLRTLRTSVAREENVPPYVVFSDRALQDMSRIFPHNPERFLEVNGVGEHKLAKYGELFLAAINNYRTAHPEDAPPLPESPAAPPRPETTVAPPLTATIRETGRLLAEVGLTIRQAADRRHLKEETIIDHMEKLVRNGERFNAAQFMAPERLAEVRGRFEATGCWLLKPVVENSNGMIDYPEARLARLLLLDNAKPPENHAPEPE